MNKWPVVLLTAAVVCAPAVDWTRFQGTVKSINLKAQTLTLAESSGDLFTIPIDYQVKIIEKKAIKRLVDIELDAKVTLVRTPAEPTLDDNVGLVPYKGQP